MAKAIIGILGSVLGTEGVSGETVKRGFANDMCVRAVAENGGTPVILPFVANPALMESAFALCDGLLLPGGCDVDPSFYGEGPHAGLGEVDRALDAFWFHAVEHARRRRIPLLGLCRGMQLLNVAWGGTLYQDLGEREGAGLEHRQRAPRRVTTHAVHIEPGTRLSRILGEDTVPTNTMHHQAVRGPGPGLVVSARASDGVIEGIETPDGLLVGVQWHPEDLIDSVPLMNRLFQDLAARAAGDFSARGTAC